MKTRGGVQVPFHHYHSFVSPNTINYNPLQSITIHYNPIMFGPMAVSDSILDLGTTRRGKSYDSRRDTHPNLYDDYPSGHPTSFLLPNVNNVS